MVSSRRRLLSKLQRATAWPEHLIKEKQYQSLEIENQQDSAKESTEVSLAVSGWNFLVDILFDGSISARVKVDGFNSVSDIVQFFFFPWSLCTVHLTL